VSTAEKLNIIRAECVRLLELSEKRTQGRWITHIVGCHWTAIEIPDTAPVGESKGKNSTPMCADRDAAFIAACAGNAEAGWKSTIAAIDGLTEIAWIKETGLRDYSWTGDKALQTLNDIISAWSSLGLLEGDIVANAKDHV